MSKDTLLAAMKKAMKRMPKVHELPKKKEPKAVGVDEPSIYYPPSLHLSTKDFPGVEKWQAGDTVYLAITAKVKSVSINERDGSKKRHSADLEIQEISDITQWEKARRGKA